MSIGSSSVRSTSLHPPTEDGSGRRLATSLLVSVAAPLAIGGVVLAIIWSSLPERVAIHWGAGGDADGFADRGTGLVALTLGLPAVIGIVLVAVVASVPASAPGARLLAAIPAATTWFIIGLVVTSLVGQTDGVSDLEAWWFVVALAAATIGAVGAILLGRRPPAPVPSSTPPPATAARLDGEAGSTLVWVGETATGRGLWAFLALALIPAIVCLVLGIWVVALIVAPVALIVLGTTRFRVTIGEEQVVAAGALGGWPRLRVPLASITRADATTTTVWEWGGWGIRARPGGAAVVTRAGPALELSRTDGTQVVVTVDDPETAAATVNTLLDRRHRDGAVHAADGSEKGSGGAPPSR